MVYGQRKCQGLRQDGKPCQGWAISGSDFCLAHDPSSQEKRRELSALGGRHKSSLVRATRFSAGMMAPLVNDLMNSVDDLLAGDLEPRTAQALASLANSIASVYRVGQLEERLRRFETFIGQLKKAGIAAPGDGRIDSIALLDDGGDDGTTT